METRLGHICGVRLRGCGAAMSVGLWGHVCGVGLRGWFMKLLLLLLCALTRGLP